jgi:hypothetical protein
MPNVNPTGVAAQKSGTVTAPSGPITWTASPSGTVNASGGGQQLNSTGTNASDGSSTRDTECSLVGQSPYLTIDYSLDNTQRQAQVTLKSATSQLSLAVSNVNAMVTSGTATVSGSMQGSAVNWQGPVDLTSNPLVAGAVPGWPKGAFTAELQRAALFAPVEKALAPPSPIPVAAGGTVPKHMDDAYGVIGRAGAWCVGGAMAGGIATGPAAPGGAFWGCVGGATASILGDWVSAIEGEVQPTPPVPPPGFPDGSQPEPVGPVLTYSHDDPPPPPPSGDPDYTPPAPGGSTDPGADGGDSGDDDGGGGSSGEGVDDKPGLQPK